MEEKSTETNKKEYNVKSDLNRLNLMAIDELYYKIKTQQKLTRCKSANLNDKKKKFNSNTKILHNEIFNKEKNNSIELPFFSPQNSTILNKIGKTINLTNLLKTNDSKPIDSTKQSTKGLRLFSGKSNSSYSTLSKTKIFENKKKYETKKKSLSIININAKVDKNYDNNIKTLKDLNIQKLIKKSKILDFNKIIDNKKNEKNIQKAQFYDIIPILLFYMKQKENNSVKNKLEKNNNSNFKHNNNKDLNYSVKYKFLDDTINNIHHIVNFVNIENREEIKKNIIKEYHENFNPLKNNDFKTYGYEFDPELIKKNYENEKQLLIKKKYNELKQQIILDNVKKVALQKMLTPKIRSSSIPEYKRIKNNDWTLKLFRFKKKKIMIDKSTSMNDLNNNLNKKEENNDTINEYEMDKFKKKMNSDLEEIKTEKVENNINKTLLNINNIDNEFKDDNNINNKELVFKNKKRKKKKDYNKIVSIETVYNFCLTGNGQIIVIPNNFNKRNTRKNTTKIENTKNSSKNLNNNINKKLSKKKSLVNFKKKKSMIIEKKYKNIIPKTQIHQFKKDLKQNSNFNIIKSHLKKEDKIKAKKKKVLFEGKRKSSKDDNIKIDISFEEIERRIVQRNTFIQISISPKKDNNNEKEEKKENLFSEEKEENEKNDDEKDKEYLEAKEEKEEKDEKEEREEKDDNIINENIGIKMYKRKISKESMLNFLEEHKINSLNFLINQKYEEIEKKNIENKSENIDNEILENQRRFSSFNDVNITSVEDIEYKKNILLYKLKEEIKNKIKDGKCDINELEHFRKFENNINEYQINYNSKDINKIKEYFLLITRKFYEFREEMNYRETQKFEEMRINKFIKNLNYELDFNIPRAIWEKGRRCHSSNLYKKLISLSEINKK